MRLLTKSRRSINTYYVFGRTMLVNKEGKGEGSGGARQGKARGIGTDHAGISRPSSK